MFSNLIGVFDSGVGGLSVLESCRAVLPDEQFLYFADKEFSPYGDKSDDFIKERVFYISENFIKRGVKAIVVACNTATNVGIKMLREKFKIPFVGLEPAIKPAVVECGNKKIILLCTPATARQTKFTELLKKHDTGNIHIVATSGLACLIEKNFNNLDDIANKVYDILLPHSDASGIILGCTHYVHIKPMIQNFYQKLASNSGVKIFDGNEGAARRLKELLYTNKLTGVLTTSYNLQTTNYSGLTFKTHKL